MFGKTDEGTKLKNERKEDLKSRKAQYKSLWSGNDVIQYKDDYCAILQRSPDERIEFIIAFSDLTKEGYRVVAQSKGGTDTTLSLTKNLAKKDITFFYFQKVS